VKGVTVYLCRRCVTTAHEAGVDLVPVITHALRRVASLLPLSTGSVTVQVRIGGIRVGHDAQVVGLSTDDDTIVSIPRSPRLLHTLAAWVPTIAHELHHTVRGTVGPGNVGSVLDRLVSEGSAVAFEEEAFPRYATGYLDDVLTSSEEAAVWQAVRPHLGDSITARPRLIRRWFLGGGGVPAGAGYVIGYHIVKGYLARHPASSAAKLAMVDSETILAGSGYAG
jgi:Predicted Zn-dependent protease (DUF2268)